MVKLTKRKALLVRVGIDSSYGEWNAPVNPDTCEFAYVPIPEDNKYKQIRPEYQRTYHPFRDACNCFEVIFPDRLLGKFVHLDPDFTYLTYGDANRKGNQTKQLVEDDIIAFYAGLRQMAPYPNKLLYAIIGLYVVENVVPAADMRREDWDKNAHTRRAFNEKDWVVFGKKGLSGRLERCIPIGEWRNKAYRVTNDLLDIWGGLSAKDGYIQRSAILPSINNPNEFYEWFKRQNIPLLQKNN